MLKISLGSRRRSVPVLSGMPALLATTSIAALLLGGTAYAGNITVTNANQATVTNPANTTTDFVLVQDFEYHQQRAQRWHDQCWEQDHRQQHKSL